MNNFTLDLREIDRSHVAVAGGKGAQLGELSRIDGIRVPSGFCVTTEAFRRFMETAPPLDNLLPGSREEIRGGSAEIRRVLEALDIPEDLAAAIRRSLARCGECAAWAVRSSATSEDLPTASFAGQHDTYLNVVGTDEILEHIRRCFASLFTERAVAYRLQRGIDHRHVDMAVVVQQMVFPQASGILFTADPTTGNRKTVSLEATFGLGEALVSGLVTPDGYKVRDGEIIARTIGDKQVAVYAEKAGGTLQRAIERERHRQPALTDAQVLRLAHMGRQIEAHLGSPQDVEWCLDDDDIQIVQSRPITTLFPVPSVDDDESHVYLSVGHQQMMTDAMKPLGFSVFQLTALRPMYEAGGRLFVDVAQTLASPPGRAGLLEMMRKSDPLFRDALQTLLGRGHFPHAENAPVADTEPTLIEADAALVVELIRRTDESVAALKSEIATMSGVALLDFILADIQELKRLLVDPQSHRAIMAAIEASWWLNDRLQIWLGEKNAADALSGSLAHNITSEMGRALLDVADVIRPFPDVVEFLQRNQRDDFLDDLTSVAGAREAHDAIQRWLDRYGMRGVGEIDITRPRWRERPAMLVPLILGNVKNFSADAGRLREAQGRKRAREQEQTLLERLRKLPDGAQKADETKRMIDRLRTFMGFREYPKFGIVCRYFVYKQSLLGEAERLVRAGVLRDREDIFYLTFQELRDVVRAQQVDEALLVRRKHEFRLYQALPPPRVLTSDGEAIAGAYRRDDLPPDVLIGQAVSAGIVEGRARVIVDIQDAALESGDILVTPYTDPSWTPLFVGIRGLVTEVGGSMAHGAVIAREYGLPAVVGVEQATQRIRDGQQIRLNGIVGCVEILPD